MTRKRVAKLFPHEDVWSDRITNQLMFVPPNYEQTLEIQKHKTILLYNGLGPWNVKKGRETFTNLKCPVYTCNITANRETVHTADLVMYKDYFIPAGVVRPPKQLYMLYFLECPYHTQHVKFPDAFNWTATYRWVSRWHNRCCEYILYIIIIYSMNKLCIMDERNADYCANLHAFVLIVCKLWTIKYTAYGRLYTYYGFLFVLNYYYYYLRSTWSVILKLHIIKFDTICI